jgi:hypothetical protein
MYTMSLVVLKRKTATLYKNMSTGQSQFSINGTRRNLGYIGQSLTSRRFIYTPMKGNVERGHGGCCGTYRVLNIRPSNMLCLNDNSVVKPSSMNTRGMISTKYQWVRRPYPYSSTKPVYSVGNSVSLYIERKARRRLQEEKECGDENLVSAEISCERKVYPGGLECGRNSEKTITKPASFYASISQGDYLRKLNKACVGLDDGKLVIVHTTQKTPFACSNSKVSTVV